MLVISERLRGRGRESRAEVDMRIFSVYWFEAGRIAKRRVFADETEARAAAGPARADVDDGEGGQ